MEDYSISNHASTYLKKMDIDYKVRPLQVELK